MATESQSLVMTFLTADGKTANITLANPKDGLTEEAVRNAMTDMVQQNVFTSKAGILTGVHSARLVHKTATDLFNAN